MILKKKKKKIGKSVHHLEITEAVLVHSDIANSHYQRESLV